MTDHYREERKTLIEKAAKAIYFRADEIGLNLNVGPIQAEALARAALAVFEKAHAVQDAEEPGDEVEYRVFDREGDLWASTNSLAEARHYLAQESSGYARIERAVWLPVEQGDAS